MNKDNVLTALIQPKGFPPVPDDWTASGEIFPASNGHDQVFELKLCKNKKGSRALLIIHGQAEHGGRYIHFPHYVAENIDCVVMPDLLGHGRSSGLRGDIADFDEYAKDVYECYTRLVKELKQTTGDAEVHLFAHSMGGLVGLRMLSLYPEMGFTSATFSAPYLGLAMKIPPVKRVAGEVMARVWGSLLMSNSIDVSLVSQDEEVQKAYLDDRLVHNKVSPRWFVSAQKVIAKLLSDSFRCKVPTQFIVPTADQLVSSEATLKFFEKTKITAKRLRKLENFRHESFNEIQKEKAFEALNEWINQNSSK